MMKEMRWVLIVAESVLSNVIESIRRNKLENSAGLSVNISTNVSARAPQFPSKPYPMLADVPEF